MEETIKLIDIIDEDFVNYKVPTFSLMFPYCTMKCNKEAGKEVCQNSILSSEPIIKVSVKKLCKRYKSNPLTKALCCYGLEPFDSFEELCSFITCLRKKFKCNDTIIIYTGYTEEESQNYIEQLKNFGNIIIKFGRYIPDMESHFDPILGIKLSSPNQYAKEIDENYKKS